MQTNTYQLGNGIYWVGVNDDSLGVFDITEYTEYGSTYNAYLVIGSEKSAIIDTVKANYTEDFIAKINSLLDIKKVDYLILNHTEPDHSGSAKALLEANPNLTVISSAPGLSNLKEIVNIPFTSIRAKNDLSISLGDKTLTFSLQPNLHWPDTMFTYVPEDEALFTCDFFGAHYSYQGVVSEKMTNKEEYIGAMKYYFNCLMAPFKTDVNRALDYIDSLPIKFVGTSHGAVVDLTFLDEVKQLYRTWGKIDEENGLPLIVVPYTSVYGYTRVMVKSIVEGIYEAYDQLVNVEVYDLVETKIETVVSRIRKSNGFVVGSTTIMGDAVKPSWELLYSLNPQIDGGKKASTFGSYGWSGEATKYMTERLHQLKMNVMDGLKIRFNPSVNQLETCKEFGKEFGKFVQNS